MERVLKAIAGLLPLIFAFAFLAPVIGQGMQAAGLTAPWGLSTLVFGFLLAGAWGAFATTTGRWI